jgi:voltage-gated potassium channel
MVAAIAFLAAYAWPIIDPELPSWLRTTCTVVVWSTWAMFAIDYVARLLQADDRRGFVSHNIVDLLVIALPLLRPLRLLRLVTVLGVVNRRAAASLRGRVAIYVVGGSALLAFVAALAVLDAERGQPDATISDFGDALWWAITTMTTVGYGDSFPVTTTGRYVAAGLMVGGIALLGTVTATLASLLIEKVTDESKAEDALLSEVAELREEVSLLVAEWRSDARSDTPRPRADPSTPRPPEA